MAEGMSSFEGSRMQGGANWNSNDSVTEPEDGSTVAKHRELV